MVRNVGVLAISLKDGLCWYVVVAFLSLVPIARRCENATARICLLQTVLYAVTLNEKSDPLRTLKPPLPKQ
jgi:hypothetical protein